MRVKASTQDKESEWSEEAEFTTPKDLWCCAWKKCPDHVNDKNKYSVDEDNPRIATKTRGYGSWGSGSCTVTGNTPFPLNSNFMMHKNTDVKIQ